MASHGRAYGQAGADRPARAAWEREMRRLRTGTRVLLAVLVALGARVVVSGLTFASGLSCAVVGALLLASLLLTRYGRRLEPASRPRADVGEPRSHPGRPHRR